VVVLGGVAVSHERGNVVDRKRLFPFSSSGKGIYYRVPSCYAMPFGERTLRFLSLRRLSNTSESSWEGHLLQNAVVSHHAILRPDVALSLLEEIEQHQRDVLSCHAMPLGERTLRFRSLRRLSNASESSCASTTPANTHAWHHRGTLPIRNCAPLRHYSRNMPRVLGESYGGGLFFMSEVPL
jgi:hypothetical protein